MAKTSMLAVVSCQRSDQAKGEKQLLPFEILQVLIRFTNGFAREKLNLRSRLQLIQLLNVY